jgi:hypothetical protein
LERKVVLVLLLALELVLLVVMMMYLVLELLELLAAATAAAAAAQGGCPVLFGELLVLGPALTASPAAAAGIHSLLLKARTLPELLVVRELSLAQIAGHQVCHQMQVEGGQTPADLYSLYCWHRWVHCLYCL